MRRADTWLVTRHTQTGGAAATRELWFREGSPAAGAAGLGPTDGVTAEDAGLAEKVGGATDPEVVRPASDDRFQRLVEHSNDMILSMDLDGMVTAANPGAEPVLGFSPEELIGTNITVHLAPHEVERGRAIFETLATGAGYVREELEHITKDGRHVFVDVSAFPIEWDGQVVGIEGIGRDVSEQHALKEALTHQSLHDPLTGLPNRALCVDRIDQALARAERRALTIAVLLFDIDDFKLINDTLGHAAGDELLVGLAARLHSVLRNSETAARMGGDEFVIVAEAVQVETEAAALGERILSVFTEPFTVAGTQRQVTASLGIALSTNASQADDLLRDADTAMYRVKSTGKSGAEIFDGELRAELLHQIAVTEGLGEALRKGSLEVHYQPIVSLTTGRILAVEALSRWHHPQLGWIHPDEFIPLAEESGMIIPLGKHVLREAARELAQWRVESPAALPLGVFVNVSPRELSEPDFVSFVTETLATHDLAVSEIAFELTEHIVIDERDDVLLENIAELAWLGVRLVIDDFGTGYSALSSLRRFPFAALKIDAYFVEEIDAPDVPAPIIRALVGLGKTLHMMVIAEGVETQVQYDYVRRIGCDAAQGFGVGRPQTTSAMSALLSAEPDPAAAPSQASTFDTEGNRLDTAGTSAPIPLDDKKRLAALWDYGVLDTEPEPEFDEIARLAAEICQTPMSFVSLVDRDREYFKAAVGTDLRQSPRSISFCGHGILEQGLFVIPDALDDPRFVDNPNVIAGAGVRFYAGAPLVTPDGHAIGMLCVKDTRPRELTETQRQSLTVLARQVAALLELRRLLAEGRINTPQLKRPHLTP